MHPLSRLITVAASITATAGAAIILHITAARAVVAPPAPCILLLRPRRYRCSSLCGLCTLCRVNVFVAALAGAKWVELNQVRTGDAPSTDHVATVVNLLRELGGLLS
jgi:hypothetical protein